MVIAYQNRYVCADIWKVVKRDQPCTTEDIVVKLGLTKATVSKLLGVLGRRGYIVASRRGAGRVQIYRVHPNSQCPVDRRQKKSANPRPVIVRTPPKAKPCWLHTYWGYFPYGPESKYRMLDTRVPEVRPEFSEAAD